MNITLCGLSMRHKLLGAMKLAGLALSLSLLVILAACTQKPADAEGAPLVDSELRDFESLQAFSDVFNADVGKPRLMLLLSPT